MLVMQGPAKTSSVPQEKEMPLRIQDPANEDAMKNNTHEVTVLNGIIDLTWRAHQEHVFYEAEETLSGTIILTPRAEIPARREKVPPLQSGQVSRNEYWDDEYREGGPW